MKRLIMLSGWLGCFLPAMTQNADLYLDVWVNSPDADAGAQVTFTIMVTNQGPHEATGVSVKDHIPAGLTYLSANSGNYSPVRNRWDIGTLGHMETRFIEITMQVNDPGQSLYMAEVMQADQFDPDSEPNNGVDTDGDGMVANDPGDEDDGDGQELMGMAGRVRSRSTSAGAGGCLVPVDAPSSFSPNGTDPEGTFKFDYWVESRITFSADGVVNQLNANYYVNSSDGSMFFPQGFFLANAMDVENNSGKIEGSLWMPNGQMVHYVFDKMHSVKRAIISETRQTASHVNSQRAVHVAQFLTSAGYAGPVADITTEMADLWGDTEGQSGRMSDGEATLYFALEPNMLPIKTNTPLLGLFVGVLKDEIESGCNRLVVFSKTEVSRSDFIIAELMSITPRGITFEGSDYKLATIGGPAGGNFQNNLRAFERRMSLLNAQKETLEEQRKRCTLDLCFDRVDRQLEALENQIDDLNCEIAKFMGVEETMDGCH